MSPAAAAPRETSSPPVPVGPERDGNRLGGASARYADASTAATGPHGLPASGHGRARAFPLAERALGQALRRARNHQIYLPLGFVRFGDYCAERLGLSLRTAQELIRVEEALSNLPMTAAAYAARKISTAHVRLIARVATEENELLWLARARRMSVRAFRRAVAAGLERDGAEGEHSEGYGKSGPTPGLVETGTATSPHEEPARTGAIRKAGILERLSGLRRAFLAGRLTLRKALLVGRVASRETLESWIRRAEAVTLRRLEDEVEYWELLRDERPEIWEKLQGGPLPEEIVLVPGHEPRLRVEDPHVSASAESSPGLGLIDGGLPETGPHAPACEQGVGARAFLEALTASEARTPLPQRMGTLRLRIAPEVHGRWREILGRLRSACDGPLEEWEALALVIRRFWQVWDNRETRRQRREHPTLERDGWRCTAPGCRSVGSGRLHEHHIVFRSAGGALTDPANLTTLCTAHHERLLHQGLLRCHGTAPDDLRWEMGVDGRLPVFLIFDGDRRTGGSAPPAHALQQHTRGNVTPLRP